MAKIGVSLKINVSQIEKARLFKGAKGQYLDATVFIDQSELDQYGNSGMITQDVSKDEKQQGVKGNILGNCKVFWVENGQAPQQGGQQSAPQQQRPPAQQPAPQMAPAYQQQAPAPRQAPVPQHDGASQQKRPAPQQAQYNDPSMDFDDDISF